MLFNLWRWTYEETGHHRSGLHGRICMRVGEGWGVLGVDNHVDRDDKLVRFGQRNLDRADDVEHHDNVEHEFNVRRFLDGQHDLRDDGRLCIHWLSRPAATFV